MSESTPGGEFAENFNTNDYGLTEEEFLTHDNFSSDSSGDQTPSPTEEPAMEELALPVESTAGSVEGDTPPENVVAIFQAANDYRY